VLTISPIYVGWAILSPAALSGKRDSAGLSRGGFESDAISSPAKLTRTSAMGLMVATAASLLITRHSVIATLVTLSLHSQPSEAFLIGSCAVLWTVANWGLASHHFPQSAKLR
jgi:hypothetical protein